MTICPIAIVVGCQKCPAFKICPLKRLIGDQPKTPEPKAPEPEARIKPSPKSRAATPAAKSKSSKKSK